MKKDPQVLIIEVALKILLNNYTLRMNEQTNV